LGKHRLVLCAFWKGKSYPVVIKIKSSESLPQSLEQTKQYMDKLGANEGRLLRFGDKPAKGRKNRTSFKTHKDGKFTIHAAVC
jgi:hypothetical protein